MAGGMVFFINATTAGSGGGSGGAGGTLAVSISPTDVGNFSTAPSFTGVTGATATASGGTSPYTYAWTKVSGDAITIASPSSATTKFSVSGMASPETRIANFRVTATDAVLATAISDVQVSMDRIGF